MGRRCRPGLALVFLAGCASATGKSLLRATAARDPALSTPPDPFGDLEKSVHDAAMKAQASASDARSAGSEAAARAAAEGAAVAEFTAKTLAARTAFQQPFLEGAGSEAEKQQGLAADGAVGAGHGLGAAQLMQKEAVANAAAWASAETQDKLADTYTGLQEWKMAVLHDPMQEAKRAAQKAVAPYRLALDNLHNQILSYEDRAKHLQSQAYALQNIAAGTAKLAVSLQGAGALGPAASNMKSAHQMIAQAANFITNAQGLSIKAQVLQLNWGITHGAATHALAEAAHRYAPDLIAPPPVDPNMPVANVGGTSTR